MKKFFQIFALALFAVVAMVCYTACKKESGIKQDETPESIFTEENTQNLRGLLKEGEVLTIRVPKSFENATEQQIEHFLVSLTTEQLKARAESYRIQKYLELVEKLEAVFADYPAIDLLTEVNLSKYLRPEELQKMKDFTVDNAATDRACQTWGCGPCLFGWQICLKTCCGWFGCSTSTYWKHC